MHQLFIHGLYLQSNYAINKITSKIAAYAHRPTNIYYPNAHKNEPHAHIAVFYSTLLSLRQTVITGVVISYALYYVVPMHAIVTAHPLYETNAPAFMHRWLDSIACMANVSSYDDDTVGDGSHLIMHQTNRLMD